MSRRERRVPDTEFHVGPPPRSVGTERCRVDHDLVAKDVVAEGNLTLRATLRGT
jgi:hypothetical protein